jgi:hypothetical protein
MRMKTKAVVLLSGGLVALVLLTRYFALSRAGMPLGWMLYLGLPVTLAGVLIALRLTNLGAGWCTSESKHGSGVRPTAVQVSEVSLAAPFSERLRELDELHASGAISDTEYSARRLQIISDM